jgi:hypothetical protein
MQYRTFVLTLKPVPFRIRNQGGIDMKLYGIWCKDLNENKGDWLRELPSRLEEGGKALLAFTSKRQAERRAADHYGYDLYSQVRRDDWCEVKEIPHEA